MSQLESRAPHPSRPLPPRRVVVRFAKVPSHPYETGVERHFDGELATAWQQALHSFPGITLRPLFVSLPPARLAALLQRAKQRDPSFDAAHADPRAFYAVDCPLESDVQTLRETLAHLPGVAKAYVESPPTRPPAITSDPQVQEHLKQAPSGVGAERVWNSFPGADGSGMSFADIEQGWTLDHVDLVDAIGTPVVTLLDGENYDYQGHGTSVLGLLKAVDNDKLCVGIAPAATGYAVSVWRATGDPAKPYEWNISNALSVALDKLAAGDVLLIEMQVTAEVSDAAGNTVEMSGLPVEAEDASYAVLDIARALGTVVVEAAGDAGEDLDDLYFDGKQLLARSPAAADFRDSEAILVAGARLDSNGAASTYLPLDGGTNYGSRIDCFAHGEGVSTIGSSARENEPLNASCTDFSGTSSASAIVAGVALAIQGMVRSRAGSVLEPGPLRALLSDETHGTVSKNGKADKIGVMPDLEALALALPDVYVRDHILDSGDPHTGPLSSSPDIIVRGAAVADPQAEFGEGSGREDDPALSDKVTENQEHHVYVRVRNRGGSDAANVRAEVYWAEPSVLVAPDSWNLIGSVTIGAVPHDDTLVVSPAIPWPAAAVPPTGHYCFLAIVGDDLDPFPSLDALTDWDSFTALIRGVNNITWRNFNVVEVSATAKEVVLPFFLTGAPGATIPMSVEILGGEVGSTIRLDAPVEILSRLGVQRIERFGDRDGEADMGRSPGWKGRKLRLREFPFPPGLRARCRLRIDLGPNPTPLWHVSVRQLSGRTEVGRITWRIRRR